MITWDLDPFRVGGGTAYAIRRLADQLTDIGVKVRILLPDWLDTPLCDVHPLLNLMPLKLPVKLRFAPLSLQHAEFCRIALETVEQNSLNGSDVTIAHNDEAALFAILYSQHRSHGPLVFWLHSLYDPTVVDYPKEFQPCLASNSLLGSAVTAADLVVTSAGILQDARAFQWPARLQVLQNALCEADDDRRVLTVESMGCLPEFDHTSFDDATRTSNIAGWNAIPSPYIFFPCRPLADKGLPIFVAMAEQLRADGITCVAVKFPRIRMKIDDFKRSEPVVWLPWLCRSDLFAVMRQAACVVVPSITEGYGLATAESIRLGVPTLYQEVGGHHSVQAFPNAIPVPLTIAERTLLYNLWADFLMNDPDSWVVWKRHEIVLKQLIDKWVAVVRRTVNRSDLGTIKSEQSMKTNVEERWGDRLRERIESDSVRPISRCG